MKIIILLIVSYISINILNAQTLETIFVEINSQSDSNPQEFISTSTGFYFTAISTSSGNLGRELWFSDGTKVGTHLVKDINSGSSSSDPKLFIVLNDVLFFSADDGVHGQELWKSDGTESGTILVKDVNPNTTFNSGGFSDFIVFNNKIFFTASNDMFGSEIWSSDGTESGTLMVKDSTFASKN